MYYFCFSCPSWIVLRYLGDWERLVKPSNGANETSCQIARAQWKPFFLAVQSMSAWTKVADEDETEADIEIPYMDWEFEWFQLESKRA